MAIGGWNEGSAKYSAMAKDSKVSLSNHNIFFGFRPLHDDDHLSRFNLPTTLIFTALIILFQARAAFANSALSFLQVPPKIFLFGKYQDKKYPLKYCYFERKYLNVHSVPKNFCLNVHGICTNLSLSVHCPCLLYNPFEYGKNI